MTTMKRPFGLHWVLVSLAGLASSGCQGAESDAAAETCPADQTLCGSDCVVLASNPLHCGQCDAACPVGASCQAGNCVCESGHTECAGSCVDLDGDGQNCGECGVVCSEGLVCSAGVCAAECAVSGQVVCGQDCVDLSSDPTHCGSCEIACGTGQACVAGVCGCSAGKTLCSGLCTDLATDGSNCGACGVSCGAGQTCSAGLCRGGGSGGTGGSAAGGGGTGGSATGGSVTGGSAAEGSATGGSATGGSATGGSPSGGTATGGVSSGTGGSPGSDMELCSGVSFGISSSLSATIGTVGVVEWSVDVPIDNAHIDYGRDAAAYEYRAPVDSPGTNNRTLLLGMKPDTTYSYRIVVQPTTGTACASEIQQITTDPVRNGLPSISVDTPLPDELYEGFTLGSQFVSGGAGTSWVYVLDKDAQVVWWYQVASAANRIRMSYDGQYMWMGNSNNGGSQGTLVRVRMDGTDEQSYSLPLRNHDFAVLPDESIAYFEYESSGSQSVCDIVKELDPETGQSTTIFEVRSANPSTTGECHSNAINWWPEQELFTLSVMNWNAIIAFTRDGTLAWTMGGTASTYSGASWSRQHQHHFLGDSLLLFNNNGSGNGSAVLEYRMGSDNTASLIFDYSSGHSTNTLGDAKRLPNGNTLITYSNNGIIQEINASKELVQEINPGGLGYTVRRRTLYGPPPPYVQ